MHFGLLRIRALEAELQRGDGSAAAAALRMLPGGCCGSSSLEKSGLIPLASKEAITTLHAETDTLSWILEPGWERSLTHCSQEQPPEQVGPPRPFLAPRQPRLCSLTQTPFTRGKLRIGIPVRGGSPKATHGSSTRRNQGGEHGVSRGSQPGQHLEVPATRNGTSPVTRNLQELISPS